MSLFPFTSLNRGQCQRCKLSVEGCDDIDLKQEVQGRYGGSVVGTLTKRCKFMLQPAVNES